jgi:hypothetical protein
VGFFGTRKIACRAGVWTTIISSAFMGLPAGFRVRVRTAGGEPIEGTYQEKKSTWIFPGTPVQGALRPSMDFERGYWNTFYSVMILPTTDCSVEID